MINVIFNPNYAKGKRVLLSRKFRFTKLCSFITKFLFKKGYSVNNNWIIEGPQKRINNALKSLKNDKRFIINKIKFNNYYFITYTDQEITLIDSLLNDKKNKIIVGPLIPFRHEKKLNNLLIKNDNIKRLVASETALNNALYASIPPPIKKSILKFPSGVVSNKELENFSKQNKDYKYDCIIYFKKREISELNLIIDFLNFKHLKYCLFEYGKYENKKLLKAARNSKFGFIICGTESQGFAIQELQSINLPLYVWNKLEFNLSNPELISGTSLTYFDQSCGKSYNTFEGIKNNFDNFYKNLDAYEPIKVVNKYLTHEVFKKNLLDSFKNF